MDSVHDHIELGDMAVDLLETPEMQRLRHISQLGTASLVYPSANHTRFEHSLGVYHLACQATKHLDMPKQDKQHIQAAALIHDIGHCPFSHTFEDIIHKHTGKYHDDVDELLVNSATEDVLYKYNLDPDRIARIVRGDDPYGGIVSGEVDVDRMDYLVRDAHHTGVPYGTIDHERLVREYRFIDGTLVLGEGNVQSAVNLLVARALMNPVVYNHHTGRIGSVMLQRATERLFDETSVTPHQVRRMDDHDYIVTLRQTESTKEDIARVTERRLYKRAVWAEIDDVSNDIIGASYEKTRSIEQDIASEAGVEPRNVIVDSPKRPTMSESTSQVVVNGEVRRLNNQSSIVEALQHSQQKQWRFGVYCPDSIKENVAKAANKIIGLDSSSPIIKPISSTNNPANM